MSNDLFSHSIFRYVLDRDLLDDEGDPAKLPPLNDLARELGVSRGKLREDMITAQAYGLIEMRPGDGTYVCPFDFYTALRPIVLYSIACNQQHFDRFYRLRAQIEVAFWQEAVSALDEGDYQKLSAVLDHAESRLRGKPVEIPHREHRDLHVLLFSRLDNPFAQGLLQVYWDAYEAVGLHRYFELSYYERMWSSHRAMVEAIRQGRYEEGKQILRQHFTLLEDRLQSRESNP